ncbi:MAG: hypothetical protein WCQ57_09350, partial [Verrucomicrobiota bacterium]
VAVRSKWDRALFSLDRERSDEGFREKGRVIRFHAMFEKVSSTPSTPRLGICQPWAMAAEELAGPGLTLIESEKVSYALLGENSNNIASMDHWHILEAV